MHQRKDGWCFPCCDLHTQRKLISLVFAVIERQRERDPASLFALLLLCTIKRRRDSHLDENEEAALLFSLSLDDNEDKRNSPSSLFYRQSLLLLHLVKRRRNSHREGE